MTDNNNEGFNREGGAAFPEDPENVDTIEATEEGTEDTHSADGDKNSQDDPDKEKPFHEHPRWKEREEEWNRKFNESESRHQEDMKKILERNEPEKKELAKTKIPAWFGGNQEAWDMYREDRDEEIRQAEERAVARVEGKKTSEEKAVADATAYMKSELDFIATDKTINPTGVKVDPNKLLKLVIDEQLVDTQGRWNYRAAFKLLAKEAPVEKKEDTTTDRKKLAGATTSESKGESKPATFKTSADFKKNRPW